MIEFKIENIIFSANISDNLDIEYLAKNFSNSKYNINEFSGLIIEYEEPKSAIFLFKNGKIICTGLKKIDEIDHILNTIIDDIEQHDISIFDDINIKIQNIVASSNLNEKLNLEFLKDNIEFRDIIHNKEKIPYLEFTIPNLKLNILLFESGKIILNNVNDLDNIKKALKIIEEKIVNI
jgi:transcription initiation factor TFIID TATA-box-binding protein